MKWVATATERVSELPTERKTLTRAGASVELTWGHPWASSLVAKIDDGLKGHEGAIVAAPVCDIMLSAPVLGEPTVESLEMIMLLCKELYDQSGGVSPHVWWAWDKGLYRITDRWEDGEIRFEPSRNVSAFYLARALEHLVNPCDECGRTGPAENAVAAHTP